LIKNGDFVSSVEESELRRDHLDLEDDNLNQVLKRGTLLELKS